MKIGVINLKSRPDRLESFSWAMRGIPFDLMPSIDADEARAAGWSADREWRDSHTGKITTDEEVACFVSHFQSWGVCQRINEPLLILEDDAIPLTAPRFDLYERAIKEYDILYLGYLENIPSKITRIDDDLIRPRYPYWLSSYVITPKGADALIRANTPKAIIPADEFVPLMIGYDHSDNPLRLRCHGDRVQSMGKYEKISAAALKSPDFVQAGAVARPGISLNNGLGVNPPWHSSIVKTQSVNTCPATP